MTSFTFVIKFLYACICPVVTRPRQVNKNYIIVHHSWGTFYQHSLTLIPACISNHLSGKVWDEITYPFLNFNGATVEVYEWITNFIPHFRMGVITYTCMD